MKRREFIGSGAPWLAWPLAARGQGGNAAHRVLINCRRLTIRNIAVGLQAFVRTAAGWAGRRNLRIETRWRRRRQCARSSTCGGIGRALRPT